jgi:hypothetical protein
MIFFEPLISHSESLLNKEMNMECRKARRNYSFFVVVNLLTLLNKIIKNFKIIFVNFYINLK